MGNSADCAGRPEKRLSGTGDSGNAQREELETILRRVLREELKAVPSQPIPQQEEAIPKEMMGFLGSLLREE